MIIRYYKGYVGTEQLRDMTKTDKTGVTAYHLVKTLNKLGFKANGLKVPLHKIDNLPVIAHVTIDSTYNHYVVIYEIDKEKQEVLIADPAKKIMKMSFENFNKIYNDIIITAVPVKKIPILKDYSVFKFILGIIKREKKSIIKILLISLLTTFLALISSYYVQILLNNTKNMHKFLFYFLFLNLTYLLLEYIKNSILIKLNGRMNYKLSLDIYKNILTLPYTYFKNRTTGEVLTRLNDIENVKDTINRVIITVFIDGILVILSSIMLYQVNQLMFIISIIILAFYLIITLIYNKVFKEKISSIKEKKEYLNNYLIESIDGIEVIKGLNLDDNFINKMDKLYKGYVDSNIKLDKKENEQYILKELINSIGMIIVLYIGITLVSNEVLEIGAIFTVMNILTYFLNPIRSIIDLNLDITETLNTIRRILEVNYAKKNSGKIEIKNIDNINIKNLDYSYNDYQKTLSNINLTINKNEKIMMIGSSGGGKSSLLKIIKNYYESKNQVFINDIEINELKSIPITYISQNEILFTDTLLNNLRLGRNININEIEKIYKQFKLDKILGLNDLIEENGFNLSGGEKQRIVLCRALLNNQKFLIIDESLNQVDVDMERILLKELIHIKDLTLIYVSHRVSNMDLFNRVIKIENGSLVENLKKEE